MFFECRDVSLSIPVLLGTLLIVACSHPLDINGEGDILSASGMHDCYLEDFQAGSEKISGKTWSLMPIRKLTKLCRATVGNLSGGVIAFLIRLQPLISAASQARLSGKCR